MVLVIRAVHNLTESMFWWSTPSDAGAMARPAEEEEDVSDNENWSSQWWPVLILQNHRVVDWLPNTIGILLYRFKGVAEKKACSEIINSCWPSDFIWRYRSGQSLALLMALLEPMLTYLQQGPVIIIWGQLHKKYPSYQSLKLVWNAPKFRRQMLMKHLSEHGMRLWG